MKINESVLVGMRSCFFGRDTECGALLGQRNGEICVFAFDTGLSSRGEYIPDTDRLNLVLSEWQSEGIELAGLAHTHLGGCIQLSDADKESIGAILAAVPMDVLYFPVITFDSDEMLVTVWRADKNGNITEG